MKDLTLIFSSPIFQTDIDTSGISLVDVDWTRNYQNFISSSQNVLDLPEFSNLSKNIEQAVNEYFYGILKAQSYVEIYITESWFNKTIRGQSHHRHCHPNSIVSGIVYLEGDLDSGTTVFYNNRYDVVEYDTVESNLFNSRTWGIRPRNGTIVLFPSGTEHFVEEYHGDDPRVTLSFNTFIRGEINQSPLKKLKIN
jgi:uncharacterized protein (TIGR02466 family)